MAKIAGVVCAAGYSMIGCLPKVLLTVAGVPMVCRVVRALRHGGLDPRMVAVVVNPSSGPQICSALERHSCGDCIRVVQPDRRGSADAALRALPYLREHGADSFILAYADMPLWRPETISRLVSEHQAGDAVVTMVTVPITSEMPKGLMRYGHVLRDKSGGIVDIAEPGEVGSGELSEADTVNPSLWAWEIEWFLEHAEITPPFPKRDGRSPELRIPPLVALAYREGALIKELSLEDPSEALGVNTAEELDIVREIAESRSSAVLSVLVET